MKVLASFENENNNKYTLIGIRGFTWFEIEMGVYVPLRKVEKFPDYCETII